MEWIFENKEWLFSGIGIFVLSVFGWLIRTINGQSSQNQKSGNNSNNIQVGKTLNINRTNQENNE